MLLKSSINNIIDAQRDNLSIQETGLPRETFPNIPNLASHALIVSGVRRCGKSTLLYQLLKEKYPGAFYLNFEDPRLYEFEFTDFSRLDEVINDAGVEVLMFDEIQIIPQWERYVRHKLDEKYKVVITGSNASLLSKELGTKLTGRHLTKELFPFSYTEFTLFKELKVGINSLLQYLDIGGFPEYVKQENDEILNYLLEDILMRDIAIRYGLRDVKSLQRLALYLVSNIGKLITGNRLKSMLDLGSTNTIMEYLSHLESSYLFHFVPKFDYSLRKQIVNPRKVYAIDNGIVSANSGSFTDDKGRKLENLVFLHLRRFSKEIFYFSDNGECDFIVLKNTAPKAAIQVCYDLNSDNLTRELNGLVQALDFFNLKEGIIVTLDQTDQIEQDGKLIKIVNGYDWLSSSPIE